MRAAALGALLLVGCPGPRQPGNSVQPAPATTPAGGTVPATADPAGDAQTGEPVEPGFWRDDELDIALGIPKGWSGHTGPSGSGLRLDLLHRETGVRMEIWSFARSGTRASPRPRPQCEPLFSDAGSHRSVPLFGFATTATCVPEDVTLPTVQGWYGVVADREIHLEVLYPPGTMIEGRRLAQPLLQSLERL